MITRTYKTKEDCARLMVQEDFDCIPSWVIMEQDGWYENWMFEAANDEIYEDDEDDEVEEYIITGEPMWGTWFIPNGLTYDWIERNKETVMDLGFTIISHAEDGLFAIGIDGAGYDFYSHHWIPLYNAMGLKWHDETNDDEEE